MKLIWIKRNCKNGDNQPGMCEGNEKRKADLFRRTCDEFKVEANSLAEELQGRRLAQTKTGYIDGMKFGIRRGYRTLTLEL